MRDNGMLVERLRARSDVRACDGRWKRGQGIRDPPNSPASKSITFFARSKIVIATLLANANTSVMALLRAAAGRVAGLVEGSVAFTWL